MKIKNSILFKYLDELYPDAHCELNYSKDYELLIAIMLSAQTTDKAVNRATANLFNKYHSLEELKNADLDEIIKCISFLGMYKNKAKYIIEIATELVDKYNGKVPDDESILISLPGVGNKTKNCYLAEFEHKPLLAVDTHVQRVTRRLGIAKLSDNPLTIEKKLMTYIPSNKLIKVNHQLIWFGRYFCKAISPNCKQCKICEFCKEKPNI